MSIYFIYIYTLWKIEKQTHVSMFMAFGLICGPFGRKSACFKQCPRLESLAGQALQGVLSLGLPQHNPSRGIAESRDVPCKHLLRQ